MWCPCSNLDTTLHCRPADKIETTVSGAIERWPLWDYMTHCPSLPQPGLWLSWETLYEAKPHQRFFVRTPLFVSSARQCYKSDCDGLESGEWYDLPLNLPPRGLTGCSKALTPCSRLAEKRPRILSFGHADSESWLQTSSAEPADLVSNATASAVPGVGECCLDCKRLCFGREGLKTTQEHGVDKGSMRNT